MSNVELVSLLEEVASGSLHPSQAVERILESSYLDLGVAKLDVYRELRSGSPEAVYAEGKTTAEVLRIVDGMVSATGRVLVTRLENEVALRILENHPEACYSERARVLTYGEPSPNYFRVAVLSAGTSDRGVAEEAAVCSAWLGAEVVRHYDVGVAGLHRLLSRLDDARRCDVVITAAGMDGALPSVVAGLVPVPVIALPTSIGYGASFAGLAALLAMLNACSPGVAVVNIDNGYGAAVLACRMGPSAHSSSIASP